MGSLERSHEGLAEVLESLVIVGDQHVRRCVVILCFHLGLPYNDLREAVNDEEPVPPRVPSLAEMNGQVTQRIPTRGDAHVSFRMLMTRIENRRRLRERWAEEVKQSRIKPKALLSRRHLRPAEYAQ